MAGLLNHKIFLNLILDNGGIISLHSMNDINFDREKARAIIQAISPCLSSTISDSHVVQGFQISAF